MKTYTVTISQQWQKAFGATRLVEADYAFVHEGALLLMQVSEERDAFGKVGYTHFLAGGDVRAQPKLMLNEFPAGFWSSVDPEPCAEGEDEFSRRQREQLP